MTIVMHGYDVKKKKNDHQLAKIAITCQVFFIYNNKTREYNPQYLFQIKRAKICRHRLCRVCRGEGRHISGLTLGVREFPSRPIN